MFKSTLAMPETQILRLLGANRGYNMDTLNKKVLIFGANSL